MGGTPVVLCGLAIAAISTILRGGTWTLAFVYVPSLLLVPFEMVMPIPAVPDLTTHRAVIVGMLLGAAVSGRLRHLFPRLRWIDLIPLSIVLSMAISFGVGTDLQGFFHQLVVHVLDWGLPYLLARGCLRDLAGMRSALLGAAGAGVLLALFALYEARMNVRLLAEIWHIVGGYTVPPYWSESGGSLRWGYLRACGPYTHTIALGTVLVTIAPLALAGCWLDRRRAGLALLASLVIAAGSFAPVSRGPMIALGLVTVTFTLVAFRMPVLRVLAVLALLASPVVVDQAQEIMRSTQADLDSQGNTDSGRYRAALLMIYLSEFEHLGPFGNTAVVGTRYEAAWSIDNGYLYMYIVGGWIGGSLFLALVLILLVRGYRHLSRSRGRERYFRACVMASFAGMAACIGDVWFAPEFASLFFVLAALVWNHLSPERRGPALAGRRTGLARSSGNLHEAAAGARPGREATGRIRRMSPGPAAAPSHGDATP